MSTENHSESSDTTEERARALLRGPSNYAGLGIRNWDTRNSRLKDVHVICVNGPPGVNHRRFIGQLLSSSGYAPIAISTLLDRELADGESPYLAMLSTPVLAHTLPDRMHVELLTKHLGQRLSQGQWQFVVWDFPRNENQAAIFEEDCSLIRAFILVEGPRLPQITQNSWDESYAALQPVFDKLKDGGRAFKINTDQEPRPLREAETSLVNYLKSTPMKVKAMLAKDVFQPAPPPELPSE
ncbi:MAG: hypothetical protein Q9221_002625 [Calogaya cf. arnoldii]